MDFVSRAGQKLHHALVTLEINPAGLVCADLGSNTGGFVDCLLQLGTKKVYAVDTGYGALAYKLRKDPRVIVMERTNAMHVSLPEAMDLITIDVAWTKQRHILPAALRLLKPVGHVVSLIKPHYEADPKLLRNGILLEHYLPSVLAQVQADILAAGFSIAALLPSPIKGARGNREFLAHLNPPDKDH
jgi:23S rRNA (cytidine1920-2'-O)/16S rRNA (cytidine1409-2'-O)-methyltransferase